MPCFLEIESITYSDYLELKNRIHKLRVSGMIDDLWLFTSHNPGAFTYGRSFTSESLLKSASDIKNTGRDIFEIERGGDITYHGPSQIMVYPFIDVPGHDVAKLVRNLEAIILNLLEIYNLKGVINKGFPGVWCEDSKIASIGIAVRKWVTMHGLSFNLKPDDGGFSMIIPCGIKGVRMTSLEERLNVTLNRTEVQRNLVNCIEDIFKVNLVEVPFDKFIVKLKE